MVERTYGAMTNDVLISIPLFVLMGYVMERGALVDKMFYSIQLAFRKVPASLAVATLIGGVLAAPFGAWIAKRVNPDTLLTFVGALLTLVSVYGLYKALV